MFHFLGLGSTGVLLENSPLGKPRSPSSNFDSAVKGVRNILDSYYLSCRNVSLFNPIMTGGFHNLFLLEGIHCAHQPLRQCTPTSLTKYYKLFWCSWLYCQWFGWHLLIVIITMMLKTNYFIEYHFSFSRLLGVFSFNSFKSFKV